jgi:hypothetical protein
MNRSPRPPRIHPVYYNPKTSSFKKVDESNNIDLDNIIKDKEEYVEYKSTKVKQEIDFRFENEQSNPELTQFLENKNSHKITAGNLPKGQYSYRINIKNAIHIKGAPHYEKEKFLLSEINRLNKKINTIFKMKNDLTVFPPLFSTNKYINNKDDFLLSCKNMYEKNLKIVKRLLVDISVKYCKDRCISNKFLSSITPKKIFIYSKNLILEKV